MSRGVALVGSDGSVMDLTGSGPYHLGVDPALWGLPPVASSTMESPGMPGARFQGARHLPRPLRCPVWVQAPSDAALDAALEQLALRVDPTGLGAPCRIVVTRGDGSQREIEVRLSSGFEAVQVRDWEQPRTRFDMVFMAHDPYWRAVNEQEIDVIADQFEGSAEPTRTNADIPTNANVPTSGFFASGTREFELRITGGVEVWPRLHITGPGSAIALYNASTGKVLSLSQPLLAGDVLEVDTAPLRRSVLLNDENAMGLLTTDSDPRWHLVPGVNRLGIRIREWTPGVTEVRLSYRERFLTC